MEMAFLLISFATSDSADYSITIITPLNILVSLNVQRFKGVKVKTIRLSLSAVSFSPFILFLAVVRPPCLACLAL